MIWLGSLNAKVRKKMPSTSKAQSMGSLALGFLDRMVAEYSDIQAVLVRDDSPKPQ